MMDKPCYEKPGENSFSKPTNQQKNAGGTSKGLFFEENTTPWGVVKPTTFELIETSPISDDFFDIPKFQQKYVGENS